MFGHKSGFNSRASTLVNPAFVNHSLIEIKWPVNIGHAFLSRYLVIAELFIRVLAD